MSYQLSYITAIDDLKAVLLQHQWRKNKTSRLHMSVSSLKETVRPKSESCLLSKNVISLQTYTVNHYRK